MKKLFFFTLLICGLVSCKKELPGGGDADFASSDKATLTAIYFPLPVDISYADEKFSFYSGGEKVYTYYLMASGAAYRTDGSTVKATLNMVRNAASVRLVRDTE